VQLEKKYAGRRGPLPARLASWLGGHQALSLSRRSLGPLRVPCVGSLGAPLDMTWVQRAPAHLGLPGSGGSRSFPGLFQDSLELLGISRGSHKSPRTPRKPLGSPWDPLGVRICIRV
jgi:hypothetical protein